MKIKEQRFSKSSLLQQGVKFEDWPVPDLRAFPEAARGKSRVGYLR